MKKLFFNLTSFTFLFSIFAISISAQVENCYSIGENRREPYPKSIREKLAKNCIERAKKDFQELLDRGEEIAKLTEEIETSYEENKKFTSDDNKKLARVEKLLKKIRRDLRADDDDNDDEKPESKLEAIKKLKEKTLKLFNELKKTSRYSISAVAIQSSNTVLKLVKFLRFKN